MATKKKNSRKALAVALGVMGIAGLSIASASQLTVNPTSSNIAVGTGTFAAACDTSVDVSYTYSIATGKYTNLVIGDIAAGCVGKSLTYTLKDNAGTPAVIKTGTVTPLTAATSINVDISTVNLTTGLGAVDVAIF